MNGEIEDGPETSSRGVVSVLLCWVAGILVFYILSTGPYVMMWDKKLILPGGRGQQVMDIVYRPVDWACDVPLLRKPLRVYWHLWAPRVYDAEGNWEFFR